MFLQTFVLSCGQHYLQDDNHKPRNTFAFNLMTECLQVNGHPVTNVVHVRAQMSAKTQVTHREIRKTKAGNN